MGRVSTISMLAVAALVVSGCVGGGAASRPSTTAPPTSAPPATVSADTGSISGLVVDEERQPVPGADVAVQGPTPSDTKSDGAGRFTFNELSPGAYTVIVQKLGYESQGRKVDVEAGKATEAQLTLVAIAIVEGYQQNWIDDGYIHLSVWTWLVGVNPTVILDDKRTFRHNISAGLVAVVSSMKWDSSAPGSARYLLVRDRIDPGLNNATQGRSPVVNRNLELEIEKKGALVVSWGLAFPCPTLSTACVDVWTQDPISVLQVAFEQRVKIYTTAFYVDPPPPGFTGLPE